MAYGGFKDLTRRTASDKILRYKAFNIAKNPKYDGYQRGLASMIYKFFDEQIYGGVAMLGQSENLSTLNRSAIENNNISKKRISWRIA